MHIFGQYFFVRNTLMHIH